MPIDQNSTLVEALGPYMASVTEAQKGQVQQELLKFVRWCGHDRIFNTLTPPEVGRYAEMVGSTALNSAKHLDAVRGFLTFANKTGLAQQNLAPHARFRRTRGRRQRSMAAKSVTSIELTLEGYEELKQRLESLKKEEVRIAEDIRRAAADKDVRENAPLEAAREHQGQVQSKIREIEQTLSATKILGGGPSKEQKVVRLGSLVEIRDLGSGQKTKYRLVNPTEASPFDAKLSSASPVGKALLNQSLGAEVVVSTPGGILKYLVLAISS